MSLEVRLISWRSKGRKMFGGMAASKGGAGSNSGKHSSRRRLDRSNANKGMDYDATGSYRRRRSQSEAEEDDSESSASREDWPDEFSVHGKNDVAEMNMMLRFIGLPGPANLGIDNEAYERVKRTPSGSPTGDFSFRQDSGRDSSYRAASPGGNLRSATSPHQPVVGQFARTYGDVSPSQPRPIQTPTSSQVRVENRTPISAGAATPIDGYTRSERVSFGFANVVRQAMEQQSRNEEDAAGVSNFIKSHVEQDLPRHGSLPSTLEDRKSPPSASDRSRLGTAPLAAQKIERAQSEPVNVSFLRSDEISVSNEKNNRDGSLKWQNVDKPENRVIQNNSTDLDRAGTGAVSIEESGPTVSGPSSISSLSHGRPHVAVPNSSKNFQISYLPKKAPTEQARPDGSKSAPMVLKPPPRMSIIKIPQDQISTNEMLGSLAPDAAEDAIRSWSSDEEENLSDPGDAEELSEASEAGLPVSGVHPEQPNDFSNGDVSTGPTIHVDTVTSEGNGKVSDTEQPKPLRNGDVIADDEPKLQGKRTALTVAVPDRVIEPVVVTPQVPVGPKHPWTKGEQLGAGSFGTVYAALDSDGVFFAVKEVSMVENDKDALNAIAQLRMEVELLSRFKHDNIVQYLGTEKAHGKLYIFLELVSRGSLAAICRAIKLSHSQMSAYTRQILKGLKYLHDRNIVHRDIKCANILVDTKGVCKLADFGMAKQLNSLDQMKSCKGSAYWMAPEVIDPKKFSGIPADIWSLGCSILEMATGSPPFGEMEWCGEVCGMAVCDEIKERAGYSKKYRVLWTVGHGNAPPIPDSLSETAKDFVMHCLDINPLKRPTATELLLHPFVRQDLGGALTPTSQDPAEVPFPTGSKTLQTIREELSADLSGAPRSQATNSLSNGHSSTGSS